LANAGSFEHIKLSDSFSIEMPTDLQAHMGFMPSSNGFWFDGKYGDHKVSIWVQRGVPRVVANSHSVKRFWQDGISQASKIGETSQDKGCQSLEKYIFSCERLAHAKEERFASETLVWNAKSDLVVVRVMSDRSFEEAETVAKMIQLKPVARLPASAAGSTGGSTAGSKDKR
jgi:hypothetical protein